MPIYIKSEREIELMREAGRIVAVTLSRLRESVRPGITTADLDAIAEQSAIEMGAVPSFKGYNGFPASLCASVNDEVVHGIPNVIRVLQEGDIVSLDFGAIYRGYHGDSAITVGVGAIRPEAEDLIEVTKAALDAGIKEARTGNRLSDISHAVQEYVEKRGFSVVRQYVGHGIGRTMHESPQIPNFGPPHKGPVLKTGMALAIEPMVNAGTERTVVGPDKWTVVTGDGKLSAHFEHTVIVMNGKPSIMTLP